MGFEKKKIIVPINIRKNMSFFILFFCVKIQTFVKKIHERINWLCIIFARFFCELFFGNFESFEGYIRDKLNLGFCGKPFKKSTDVAFVFYFSK